MLSELLDGLRPLSKDGYSSRLSVVSKMCSATLCLTFSLISQYKVATFGSLNSLQGIFHHGFFKSIYFPDIHFTDCVWKLQASLELFFSFNNVSFL